MSAFVDKRSSSQLVDAQGVVQDQDDGSAAFVFLGGERLGQA